MRLDGYIRVSQVRGREGVSFISPDVQRSQIEAWAKLRGATIAEWHTDLDQSGAKAARPGLVLALRRVEEGSTDGIVVARLDRFARSLTQALEAIQRVDSAGGMVVSVAEGIDPSTAAGKMMMRLLLVFAEWELDRIRENWRTARQRAVSRGVHIASRTPTGYRRRDDGTLELHATAAPVVREVFERRVAGASWRDLADLLQERGVVGPYGAPHWTARSASHIIRNPVYLGEARSGEYAKAGAHDALVDKGTWEAAQRAKGVPSVRGEPALLSGVLRCAGCRHLMKPDRMKMRDGTRERIYRCRGEHSMGRCESRAAVLGSVIEPWVEGKLLDEAANLWAQATTPSDELRELERAAAEAEADVEAYRDERIIGVLGSDRYVAGLRERVQRADAAHEALAVARSKLVTTVGSERLDRIWPQLETTERRAMLVAAIDAVMLRSVGQANVPIGNRAIIFWRGEGPADLPTRGRRVPLRPFDWPKP